MLDSASLDLADLPATFFERELIRVVVQAPARFAALTGSLAVDVQGRGAWTIHLGDLDNPVVAGFERRADAKLWLMRDGFARFLDGTLDPRDKLRVLARGDLDVIARFGRLLSTDQASALSVRFVR